MLTPPIDSLRKMWREQIGKTVAQDDDVSAIVRQIEQGYVGYLAEVDDVQQRKTGATG